MRATIVSLIAVATLLPITSSACTSFGRDASPIEKVQSSWLPAEIAMSHYRYAEAVRHLNSTYGYVSKIKDPFSRKCVDGGAQIRITSAKAVATYLSLHSGDFSGAKNAADKAWRTYPLMHNCP